MFDLKYSSNLTSTELYTIDHQKKKKKELFINLEELVTVSYAYTKDFM